MISIVQTIQKTTTLLPSKQSLPVSAPTDQNTPGLRRRLSSLSLKFQPISASPAATWALHRSKSLSSMGENAGSSIKRWWDWGWTWFLSKKPIFTKDLEMNEEEKHVVGLQNRGSLKHILYKVRSEVRKLLRHDDMTLPQTLRYDSSSNFNGGFRRSTIG